MMIELALQNGISGSGAAAIAAVGFFLAFVVVAYIAFRILRKTVKMALRVAIVGLILVIAIVGSISLWWFNSGNSSRPKSNSSRSR